jgi:hypothetical protein
MTLIEITSYDDVRAALGVSEDELKDTTLSLDLYAFNLTSELEGISLTLIPTFTQVKAIAAVDRTDVQTRLFQAAKLFATYAVAKQLCTSLPLFAPKEQTDGKASLGRFSSDPYKATIARITADYETAVTRVAAALEGLTPEVPRVITSRPYFSVVAALVDPVTGA